MQQFWKDFKVQKKGGVDHQPNVTLVISQFVNINKINDIVYLNTDSMVISYKTINNIINDLYYKNVLEKTELTSNKHSDRILK